MASLIIQDSFEPYYEGREDEAKARLKPRAQSKKPPERGVEGVIILPDRAPMPMPAVRRDRRVIAH